MISGTILSEAIVMHLTISCMQEGTVSIKMSQKAFLTFSSSLSPNLVLKNPLPTLFQILGRPSGRDGIESEIAHTLSQLSMCCISSRVSVSDNNNLHMQ